jgi:hypothetical protein
LIEINAAIGSSGSSHSKEAIMFAFRVVGGNLIPEAEYQSKREELAHVTKKGAGEVAFSSGGRLTPAVLKSFANTSMFQSLVKESPEKIGKGEPCTILIREVWTGEFPHPGIFGGKSDLVIVSGVKSYEATNATARALNFIETGLEPGKRLERGSAFKIGTPVVAYSPAVTTDSWTLTFEFGVATFPTAFIDSIAKVFSGGATQIPMLLPYAGYLMGAGQLLKLASNIGHALYDGIVLSVTAPIDFDVLGVDPLLAGFRIISPYDFAGAGYTYSPNTGVTRPVSGKKENERYEGPGPYIVISLDGKKRDNLKDFAPLAATAAILQRFFEVPEAGQVAVDSIFEALKLASDLKYHRQAVELKEQLDRAQDQATKASLKTQLDAAQKNILTKELQIA